MKKNLLLFICFLPIKILLSLDHYIDEKLLILGVCKNTARGFNNVKNSVQGLVPHFLDYQIIIYENNSNDKTKELYRTWSEEEPKLIFISEHLTNQQLAAISLGGLSARIAGIARAREIVLQKALEEQYEDFKYILMADLDEFYPWDINGICKTILEPAEEWDAVFANGSYDVFALRSQEFPFGVEHIGYDNWFGGVFRDVGIILGQKLKNNQWLEVESAYGGLALYKRESLKDCHYHSQINQKYYDWMMQREVNFDLVPEFKRSKLQLAWEKNKQFLEEWKNNNFINSISFMKLSPFSYIYPCEHIWLHYDMIEHGRTKLFINPQLKMQSRVYRNF